MSDTNDVMESISLRQLLDETMDWASDLPEDELRQIYPELRIPQNVDFCRTIGGTEYTVVSHFNRNVKDDIFHKVRRLADSGKAL